MNEVVKWGRWRIVWVDSSEIESCISLRERGLVDGLGLSPWKGYPLRSLEFLNGVDVGGLVLPAADHHELSGICRARNVKFLSLSMFKDRLDFGQFKELVELSTDWHPEVTLPNASCLLENLALSRYRPRTRDLTELPCYQNLQYLGIVQGNLESLSGAERFTCLTTALFCYLPHLKQVAALRTTPIEELRFKSCKRIADLATLSACTNLRKLALSDCGRLQSLRILNSFRTLEEFRFVGTQVEDGDMSPLLRLKAVGFLKNNRYSHTPEQIDTAIQQCPRDKLA